MKTAVTGYVLMREGEGWPAVLWKENTEKQVVVPGWDSLEYTMGKAMEPRGGKV